MSESEFVYTARTLIGTRDTRHEAVGDLARLGDTDGDRVAAVHEDCLVSQPTSMTVGPKHLGNQCYGDRDRIATTHGIAKIEQVSLVRHVNGVETDAVESWWEIECPVCYITHEVDGAGEDARRDAIDDMLDCCGIEWQPPADYLNPCSVCGESHRESNDCSPPVSRDPYPDLEQPAECSACGWAGRPAKEALAGPNGNCPECGSPAVHIGGEAGV